MPDNDVDPLRVALQHIEEQLDDRVGALNDAKPAGEESTADLIQLEETLSSAQDKAKKVVSLRLKLDEEEAKSVAPSDETSSPAPSTSPEVTPPV